VAARLFDMLARMSTDIGGLVDRHHLVLHLGYFGSSLLVTNGTEGLAEGPLLGDERTLTECNATSQLDPERTDAWLSPRWRAIIG
jgi:hypothetical protein